MRKSDIERIAREVAQEAVADAVAKKLLRVAVTAFAAAILHGSEEHRAWLMEAAERFSAGEPLPPPRG